MCLSEPIVRGRSAYARFPISHQNNLDIQRVYEFECKRKIRDGGSKGSHDQFLVAIGLFARLCVVLRKVRLEELCESGRLFK